VHRNGECHYFVDQAGKVLRIIDRKRVALHAGRSMWKGRTSLDKCSIGIEVVGYHNKSITSAQCSALKELIAELQRIYEIPDERVLTHSMVAYGAPNQWHKRSHRGRKRCGMLFAKWSVRVKLGLRKQPKYDPDVKAGRLVNADPYLTKVLYGTASEQEKAAKQYALSSGNVITASRSAWDIARDKYMSAEVTYVFPNGKQVKGNAIKNWKAIPPGTKVLTASAPAARENVEEGVKTIGVNGYNTPWDIAGEEYGKGSTIYFLPDGKVTAGDKLNKESAKKIPKGTKVLVGYTYGGLVTANRRAFDICGARWNFPSTYYRLPDGSVTSGSAINENAIPKNTRVYYRN